MWNNSISQNVCHGCFPFILRDAEMYVDTEMFPSQINISEFFPKKIYSESKSTMIPKLSSWIVMLISSSSVNACSAVVVIYM